MQAWRMVRMPLPLHISLVQLAAIAAAIVVATALPSPCPDGCTKYGNCNAATGTCECPFGRGGEVCEIDYLPSCRMRPEANAYCGHVSLKPCDCIDQCRKYLCNGTLPCDTITNIGPHRVCFKRKAPRLTAIIDPPDENEADVTYYRYPLDENLQEEITFQEAIVAPGTKDYALPLDRCPQRCNENGACVKAADDPVGTPRCLCYLSYEGAACEEQRNVCPSECLGRGKCLNAFCHCNPPYWGIGCAKDSIFELDNNTRPNVAEFKIYIYDLPSWLAIQQAYWAGFQQHDQNYVAYQHFTHQLLKSSVVTQNPLEAHLFFIPALTYAYSGNLGDPNPHLERVIPYIKSNFPFWNRTQGRDHFVWVSGDRNSCLLKSIEAQSLIKIVHFGFYDSSYDDPSKILINPANKKWGCFHPLRDVVAAPFLNLASKIALETHLPDFRPKEMVMPNRTRLFFFAGGVRPEDEQYSGGSRQLIAEWIPKWNDSEFAFVPHVDDYIGTLRSSKFCLTPYGHGWGIRIVFMFSTGCIPVIIQENVFQPYEDILPYEEFSIRLNNEDIPHLPSILRAISSERLEELQKNLKKYWQSMIWPSEDQGRAFDYTILSLRRRYLNLKSKYYGHHQPDAF